MKDQFARRARRINEAITDRPKADTAIAQFLDKLDQVVHRASKSVKPPDKKRVPLLQFGKAGIQRGAIRLRSRDLLCEDVVWIDAEASQRVNLKGEVLVVRTNARSRPSVRWEHARPLKWQPRRIKDE